MRFLRAAAVLIAVAAAVDVPLPVRKATPAPVELRASDPPASSGLYGRDRVSGLRQRLESRLHGLVDFAPTDRPSAVVLVGDRLGGEPLPDDVPISVVTSGPAVPSVHIVRAVDPAPVLVGWAAVVDVTIEATGMAGSAADVILEANGIEVRRVTHWWTHDREWAPVRLTCPMPEPGVVILTVRARPRDRDRAGRDSVVDLRAVAEARVLKVAAYDPRPSWASSFVRRALEGDPAFDVSTIVRTSKGFDVRSGRPPDGISAATLEPFDLVVVGAPEELSASEAGALASFSRRRGGAVALVPDRRPAGAYVALVGAEGFDEMLVDRPAVLTGPAGVRLRASEFALPKPADGAAVISAVLQGTAKRPVVLSMPSGAGQVIFSGALDAWRYRGTDDDAFARFWRGLLAAAAASAPRRVDLAIQPAIATPGLPLTVRATVRRTEFDERPDRSRVPAIAARVIGVNGSATAVRLWPTPEIGVFEGRFEAPAAGRYDVRASIDGGAAVDVPLVVSADAHALSGRDEAAVRLVAEATGGIVTTDADLEPLVDHLARLPRSTGETTIHLMQSPWWMLMFVSLLCAEWTVRRNRGGR